MDEIYIILAFYPENDNKNYLFWYAKKLFTVPYKVKQLLKSNTNKLTDIEIENI